MEELRKEKQNVTRKLNMPEFIEVKLHNQERDLAGLGAKTDRIEQCLRCDQLKAEILKDYPDKANELAKLLAACGNSSRRNSTPSLSTSAVEGTGVNKRTEAKPRTFAIPYLETTPEPSSFKLEDDNLPRTYDARNI